MLNESISNKTNEVKELDLVFINEKEVMTDSLTVARYFERRHDNVMRGIKRILKETKDIPNALIFEEVSYIDQKGEKRKKYVFGKDATILLVMGYTGEKAMSLKINYINAFNAMYEHLKGAAKSLQETLFNAVRENDISEAESSLAGKILNKRKHDKPRLLSAIERAKRDIQSDMFLDWSA